MTARGIPTLRHDWNWPIDRLAVPSFFSDSVNGWLSVGFGLANPHPTTYLIAIPLAAIMWLFGPLVALGLMGFVTGYCCARAALAVAARWGNHPAASCGIALFVIFNPWVYNQVVAGHLVMVLAYGGFLGLLAEMARGGGASPIRLALWVVLIEAQLQFFIVALAALIVFAIVTKKWLPVVTGILVALPSIVGLIAERGVLLQTPYSAEWQANQSILPLPLLSLGGYFAGYADRLGLAAQIAVWAIVAFALAGVVVGWRRRSVTWAAAAAAALYLVTLGVHGPLGAAYVWIVRYVPESGVFRELYDLAGLFAALLALLAAAATPRARAFGYLALAAGIVLPTTWLMRPPSDLWIPSGAYPHPSVAAPAFSRVALLPAFQPLMLRAGGGDGADPDSFVYPDHVAALNEYLPSYPVDMALALYEQTGNAGVLRGLGVGEIVSRPWLVSRSNGTVGLAASSLALPIRSAVRSSHAIVGWAPLIAQCDRMRIVAAVQQPDTCDVFFGDAPGYGTVSAIAPPGDSIDPHFGWIDARLAFARDPSIAQGIGGTLTQSSVPHPVRPGSWLLANVRGRLNGADGRMLAADTGTYVWISIPPTIASVVCRGLCELAAQTQGFPAIPLGQTKGSARAVSFHELTPWLYRLHGIGSASLLRFNERYDPGWFAIGAWHALPHVRVGVSVNGWLLAPRWPTDVVLLQVTALLQLVAELVGAACVVLLLKALVREPTKRA